MRMLWPFLRLLRLFAVDLMEIAVKAGAVVAVAHDDRLARPGWRTRQFKPTDLSLAIDGQPMNVIANPVRARPRDRRHFLKASHPVSEGRTPRAP